ncbi:helix-turn-helix domain-containing protein [Microbacterium aurantiacum]|uniref:helix-turn-helix domain-containing protein n=1 Tax=Microbacterium aurantiacum TaxID=162393 RepID=UPI0040377524
MSIAHDPHSKWSFGLPDRLNKALTVAGISNMEMAEYLGVSSNTIGNYISGRTTPKKQTLRLWALRTGAPLAWIESGETQEAPQPDGPTGGLGTGSKRPESGTPLYHP